MGEPPALPGPEAGLPPAPSPAAWARIALLVLLSLAPPAAAQSSFDTDPFAAAFREKSNLDLKFKVPEKGGDVKIRVPEGETGGRLALVAENVYEAEAPPGKRVVIEYQDLRLEARKVRADSVKKTVLAEGDVIFVQGQSRLTGARLDLDLNDKIGVLTDGTIDLEGGVHLRGATLSKVGPKTFTLTHGTLTACEGEKPAWIFSVASGRVTLEGYARLKNVVFRLGGVPLLYTPYLLWPALRDRASGFLIPGLGYSSLRGGYLGVSYYQVLGRSADATVSADLFTKKFFGIGTELRAQTSAGTRAEGIFYTVRDPEGSWEWKTKGTIVSDDLGPGLRGVVNFLQFSDQAFFQTYDRDFNLTSTRSVKSEAFVTRNAGPLALNLRLDREEAQFGSSTVVTERRPVLEARLRPTPLFGQLLFVEAEGQVGQLRASRGAFQPSGSYDRFDLFPKASIPLSPFPWLSLQANAGARLTSYGATLSPTGQSLDEARFDRHYVQAGLELTGPSFARIFESGFGPYARLKHVIEPRVDYRYLEGPDLERAPLFDEVDSVTPLHTLRYALVQRLLGKGKEGGAREIASLELSSTYYIKALPGSGSFAPSRNAPLDAVLRLNASSKLNMDGRVTYDASARQVTSASLTASLNAEGRSLSLSVFDSRPVGAPEASAQLRFGGGMPILPKRIRFDATGNYDLAKGKMLESRYLLTFEGSCFKILTEYRDLRLGDVPSRDYRIALTLKNVGSFLDFTGSLAR